MKKVLVKVGLVQTAVSDDVDKNLEKTARYIKQAARKGAEIVCLPELFRSLYFCDKEDYDNFSLAESIPGSSTQRLGSGASSCAACRT